jgi:DNA topoisomerase-1
MKLIIVESPTKIKKIESILGKGYKCASTAGHIMDLDHKQLSNMITNNFEPIYAERPDKKKIIKDLRSIAKKADEIFIGTDFDREGEVIGANIAKILNLKNPKRITFISVTKKELQNAINNPTTIDKKLLDSQKTRRMLDIIVGFELSPLLDKELGLHHLSAGRVQSVITRLIVDRENEIRAFMNANFNSYFKFKADFLVNNKTFTSQLHNLENKNKDGSFKGEVAKIPGKDESLQFLNNCKKSEFTVAHVFTKKRIQGPQPPFTTSSLQQEANRKFNFGGKVTMMAAQKLYETGWITYIRTDSTNLSEEAMENIKKYVLETYGNNYYNKKEYKSKNKHTQEAHECIRPTDCFSTTVTDLGPNEVKLYSLIWKRTVASQMKPAEFNVTSIQIGISEIADKFFMTNIENLIFPGYLSVYGMDVNEEDDNTNQDIEIPKIGTKLNYTKIIGKQTYDSPPGRYNYGSLVDKISPKNLNIGRPATYAPSIEKIIERGYIKIGDIEGIQKESTILVLEPQKDIDEISEIVTLGKEKGKYIPTQLGILVNNYLVMCFPKIIDYHFTSQMEEKLDEIATGNLHWQTVLKEFYDEFHPTILKNITKCEAENNIAKFLGKDPKTGFDIYAKKGMEHKPIVKMIVSKGKPRYAAIEEPLTLETITLDQAIKLFEFPKTIGTLNGCDIIVHKGKNGPYLENGKLKANITDHNITLDEAIKILKEKSTGLGLYNNIPILLKKSVHGHFIAHGDLKISISKDNISFDEAVELIKERSSKYLKKIEFGNKIYTVAKGPYSVYLSEYDIKTKKKSNYKLPKNEDIENLSIKRVKEIIKPTSK